jgi:hypothetical protein
MEENNNIEDLENEQGHEYHITAVNGLYENWFLDYASVCNFGACCASPRRWFETRSKEDIACPKRNG